MDILKGTYLRDAHGKPLKGISLAGLNEPPPAPPGVVILAAYDFGPDGARFNPAITVTFKFDPQSLPGGAGAADLKIAVWDGNIWQVLDGKIDSLANTISASISHFCDFALLGPTPAVQTTRTVLTSAIPVVTTSPEIAPENTVITTTYAAPPPVTVTVTLTASSPSPVTEIGQTVMALSDLKIIPSQVKPGEPVEISILVNGTGNQNTYTVTLKINDVFEDSRTITPGEGSRIVTFVVSRDLAGDYSVNIEGLTGMFTVVVPSDLSWLWWLLGSGLVIISGFILYMRRLIRRD